MLLYINKIAYKSMSFMKYLTDATTLAEIGIKYSINNNKKLIIRKSAEKIYLNCQGVINLIQLIKKRVKKDNKYKDIYIISNFSDSVYLRIVVINAMAKLLKIKGFTVNIIIRDNGKEKKTITAIESYLYALGRSNNINNNINIRYSKDIDNLDLNILLCGDILKMRKITDKSLERFVVLDSNIAHEDRETLHNNLSKLFTNAQRIYDKRAECFVDNPSAKKIDNKEIITAISSIHDNRYLILNKEFEQQYTYLDFIEKDDFNYVV